MSIQMLPTDREAILTYRDLYRQELNCQIVHDSAYNHDKCVQPYLLKVDGEIAGYGSIWIGPYWMPKGSAFEFYVTSAHRSSLFLLFEEFLEVTKPSRVYAQTNDPFLGVVIYDYIQTTIVGAIVFEDHKTTHLSLEDVIFRRAMPEDKDHIFPHLVEPVGDWVLETEGRIVATGGIGYHYNQPYGDIFMEVEATFHRRGFGSFLVQELKRVCREADSVPAARTRPTNIASRTTLEKAGFAPCARLIYGDTSPVNSK